MESATQSRQIIVIPPDDDANRTLVQNVHPADWVNPEPAGRYNLVVVGAGTAGLVTAAGSAGLGARVALIERHLMGGDCLNVGCVPSKAVLRAARAWTAARRSAPFGIQPADGLKEDFAAVMARMRALRAGISHTDSVHRYKSLGVDVFIGEGRFTGPDTIEVSGKVLRFAKAAICTGGRAAALPIPGLEEAGYLTNETVFELVTLPQRLIVIGAGPIGCELAQAFARFGSQVTVLEKECRVLPREDPDAARVVEQAMIRDGVQFICDVNITKATANGTEKVIQYERKGEVKNLSADAILLGVGRTPNVEGLNLEAAGVEYDRSGVKVNDRLQTTNARIFAAGDICSRFKFTHAADAMARIVIANALFSARQKASALTIPWCTYTEPELAHVGVDEQEAAARGLEIRTFTWELKEVDRAVLDGETEGFARVHVAKGTDRILGATIVAAHAGDLISEITLAMANGLGLGAISKTVHPYPTQAEVIKKLGDAYQRTRLTPLVKKVFRGWFAWRRR